MFCKNCGAKLPENCLFCNNCGQPVPARPDSGQPSLPHQAHCASTVTAAKPGAGMIVLISLLGIVAVVVLVFLGMKLFAGPSPNAQAFAQAYASLMESATYGNDAAAPSQPTAGTPPSETASALAPSPAYAAPPPHPCTLSSGYGTGAAFTGCRNRICERLCHRCCKLSGRYMVGVCRKRHRQPGCHSNCHRISKGLSLGIR